MSNLIPLSDIDLEEYVETDLGSRSNVSAQIAEALAMGGCAVEWNSSQLASARKLIAPEATDDEGKTVPAGLYFGKVTITQLSKMSQSTREYKNGKTVVVDRLKREMVAIRPA